MIQLSKNQVHVWQLSFDALREHQALLATYLNDQEAHRAHQFKRPQDMGHYQLCRGALRKILSLYLPQAPAQIDIENAATGKPFVPNSALQFNVSHSGQYALVAVSYADVGVDIENSARHRDMLPIAKRFFAEAEYKALTMLPEDEQSSYACQLWCCKEAFVKAIGEGIAFGLNQFDIALQSGEADLVSVADTRYVASEWRICLLKAPLDYLAALAVRLPAAELAFFDAVNYLV